MGTGGNLQRLGPHPPTHSSDRTLPGSPGFSPLSQPRTGPGPLNLQGPHPASQKTCPCRAAGQAQWALGKVDVKERPAQPQSRRALALALDPEDRGTRVLCHSTPFRGVYSMSLTPPEIDSKCIFILQPP